MLNNKKIVVVLPAYNAEKTLEQPIDEIPKDIVDEIIITDDFSTDATIEIAKKLGIKLIIIHDKNLGYGANQKSCYQKAFELHADIIIMLHPDYQYTPKLIPALASLVANNLYDVVLGSRMLLKGALKGGMPLFKYVSNWLLTFFQNILMNQKLSEYYTGYRCYNAEISYQYHYLNYTPNSPFLVLFYNPFSILDIAFSKSIFNVNSFFLIGKSIQPLYKYFKIEKID